MVFSTMTLFKGIQCPKGRDCAILNCIYAHDTAQTAHHICEASEMPVNRAHDTVEPTAKRRKTTEDMPSRYALMRDQAAAARSRARHASEAHGQSAALADDSLSHPPSSLLRPISPPAPSAKKKASPSNSAPGATAAANGTAKPVTPASQAAANSSKQTTPAKDQQRQQKTESLNPRLIANDPAGHQKRLLFLKHLHAEMARLNSEVTQTVGLKYNQKRVLSEQDLIKLSLDDEERIARTQPKLYSNVVKQRVVALKKMSAEDWVAFVTSSFVKETPEPVGKEEKRIETGLALEFEHLILPHLVADQKPLAAFGYITNPPSESDAVEAAAAVEASRNYEICDRCSARFQVYPGRNEDGRLGSGGPCIFHPNRKVFPPKTKADKGGGAKEPYYPCCNENVGARGCTRSEEHVFKTNSPARLAATLPFITTPENLLPALDTRGKRVEAVAFDCEMGYTVYGMELIRLTAISWPSGEELLDVLVRPLGAVLDLNSRFSGIFPEHFKNAVPYDEWRSSIPAPPSSKEAQLKPLPIVSNPQRARELLCSFLQPSTPLLGHAIDNDLNTVRLCHPTIVDTVLLYPHPRGLPMRFGLRMLAQKHLNRRIQTGGERGHDSREDAVATGDLVRVKVGEKWKTLKSSGWQIRNDQLIPPPSLSDDKMAKDGVVRGGGMKRKVTSTDGADDDGDKEQVMDG